MFKTRKVVIVGAGHVGSHVALALIQSGEADDIVLIDILKEKAIGQALDLPTDQRVEGTMVTTVMGVLKGAAFVRVHDVKENLRAIRMTQAILRDGRNG